MWIVDVPKKRERTHFLAVLKEKVEIGPNRYWRGFLLDTPSQAHVDRFMRSINQADYTLIDPCKLEKNAEGAICWWYTPIVATSVNVQTALGADVLFTLKAAEEPLETLWAAVKDSGNRGWW
jgi:hypothetical protein